MDDSGYFSVQVISSALKVWGLELIPYNSTESAAIMAQNDPLYVIQFFSFKQFLFEFEIFIKYTYLALILNNKIEKWIHYMIKNKIILCINHVLKYSHIL